MQAVKAEGPPKVKCQIDNDRKTSGKNGKKKKSVSIWIKPFFKPGASVVNFMGNCTGSGGHHDPHARAVHPALHHLSNQQRGKSPGTEQVLCGMQSIADPAPTRALLAFQLLLEKTSYSRPLSPSPSLALPVQTPMWRKRHMREACKHQGRWLEPRLPVAAPAWLWVEDTTTNPPDLQEPRCVSHPHCSSPREERGPGAPKGETLRPCEFV